jgi:hypothetical protein
MASQDIYGTASKKKPIGDLKKIESLQCTFTVQNKDDVLQYTDTKYPQFHISLEMLCFSQFPLPQSLPKTM